MEMSLITNWESPSRHEPRAFLACVKLPLVSDNGPENFSVAGPPGQSQHVRHAD